MTWAGFLAALLEALKPYMPVAAGAWAAMMAERLRQSETENEQLSRSLGLQQKVGWMSAAERRAYLLQQREALKRVGKL